MGLRMTCLSTFFFLPVHVHRPAKGTEQARHMRTQCSHVVEGTIHLESWDTTYNVCLHNPRKFRSQTSDNKYGQMENHSQEEAQAWRDLGKSPNTVFFQCFVASEGRKVGWLKRRKQSQLAT